MNADEIRILSAFICGFGDAAAGAYEPPPLNLVYPFGERRALRPVRALVQMVMFTLSVLCAAVFTEPAIPQIEEVGRLVHRI